MRMLRLPLRFASLSFFVSAVACSSADTTQSPQTPQTPDPAEAASDAAPTVEPTLDAGSDTSAAKPGPIGALVERGEETIKGDPKSPISCDQLCKDSADGTCDASGARYAGYSYYNCGTRRNDSVFYSCSRAEPVTTVTNNQGSCTMRAYECYCKNAKLTVPRVRVAAADLPTTCRAACESHGLTCDDGNARQSYASSDETGATRKPVKCDESAPVGTNHLSCACPKP
jgi:hypothetical protein